MRLHDRITPSALRAALALLLIALCMGAQQKRALPLGVEPVLERISADSLRGHLSFIASDLLEGRDTPSAGLEIAANYIAAQFRRAGLEPAGDDGYFQTANWVVAQPDPQKFEMKIKTGGEVINVDYGQVSLPADTVFDHVGKGIIKVEFDNNSALDSLKLADVRAKVVITEIPDYRRADRSRMWQVYQSQNAFMSRLAALEAALVISIDRTGPADGPPTAARLIDPDNRISVSVGQPVPLITVLDPRAVKAYDAMKPGATAATLSARLGQTVEKPVKLRNCIGVLRGSDPALKDTYVLVTAHYDHVGKQAYGEGDRIFNGANDDGSGTVSVIELAQALATINPRPRRSIVFMTFFGEEKGMLGSRYYGRRPVFPIEKTVANVNLEQVGRTDSTEGPQISTATLTGFDYSDVSAVFKAAGEVTGVNVYKHERNSDAYFGRSDNQALADQGVPAHTLCVAFAYPDYHGLGDHWEKIDYSNMEKINRLIAVALVMMANNPDEPKWNEANPRAARYVQAWRARRGM